MYELVRRHHLSRSHSELAGDDMTITVPVSTLALYIGIGYFAWKMFDTYMTKKR